MASLKCIAGHNLRNIFRRNISMTTICRAEEELLEKLKEKNAYFEKYADKIAKLQQTSPKDFLERVDKVINPIKVDNKRNRSYSELLNPKGPAQAKSAPETPHKKLADVMKLELIADKSAEDITKIWLEYHKTKSALAATLTEQQFEALMIRAKSYPIFILPLPRSEGYEFIMLQFAANTVHFTPLLAYQVHAENAPECLTLVHYTETKDKGIVLMRGEFDEKVLSGQEAQCLVNQLQLYYCMPNEAKLSLLETFTKKPAEFKHMQLVKELENIQLK